MPTWGSAWGNGQIARQERTPVRALPEFFEHLSALGFLEEWPRRVATGRFGGWLKMGIVGTTPAMGPILLVSDAAIFQAMSCGRARRAADPKWTGFAAERC